MYDITPKNGQFEMPALPYSADALNVISAKTFEFHHGKHLKAYVDNLNKLLPGTMPPPSTRSNSSQCVCMRTVSSYFTSSIRTGSDCCPPTADCRTLGVSRCTTSSSKVFHLPHSGQRPSHELL